MRSTLIIVWRRIRNLLHPSNAVLIAYMDGELEHDLDTAIRKHLEHCRRCVSELDQLQEGLRSFDAFSASLIPQFGLDSGLRRFRSAIGDQGGLIGSSTSAENTVNVSKVVYAHLLSELSIYIGRNAAIQLLNKCNRCALERDRLNETVRPMVTAFLGERTASAVLANVLRIWDGSHLGAT